MLCWEGVIWIEKIERRTDKHQDSLTGAVADHLPPPSRSKLPSLSLPPPSFRSLALVERHGRHPRSASRATQENTRIRSGRRAHGKGYPAVDGPPPHFSGRPGVALRLPRAAAPLHAAKCCQSVQLRISGTVSLRTRTTFRLVSVFDAFYARRVTNWLNEQELAVHKLNLRDPGSRTIDLGIVGPKLITGA